MQLLLHALGHAPSSSTSEHAQLQPTGSRQPHAASDALSAGSLQQQQQHQHPQSTPDEGVHQSKHEQHQQEGRQGVAFGGQQGIDAVPILSLKDLRQLLFDIASRADETALALKEEGAGASVPYVWQLVYVGALELARTGAMQEIFGQFSSCIQPYSQVAPTGTSQSGLCLHSPAYWLVPHSAAQVAFVVKARVFLLGSATPPLVCTTCMQCC